MYLLLFVCFLSCATASPAKRSRDFPKINGASNTGHLPRQAPDSDPSMKPGYTLNPEWSPDSKNHVPVSLDPISPFNDNGRSQMVDNFVPALWIMNCPALALNCNRCPRDLRCYSTLHTTVTPLPVVQRTPQPAVVGGHNVIAGQHDSDIPTVAGPESLNIFVNLDVLCETSCDTLFCGKARKGRGCEGLQSLKLGSADDTVSGRYTAQEDYATVTPSFRSLAVETPISTFQNRIRTSTSTVLGQSVSTARGVPKRRTSRSLAANGTWWYGSDTETRSTAGQVKS
ncbi:hypothetical protein P171DRAFT_518842 [Karstenula rhodostoma CBS 690.94]|uniref:Uncharacterized protein n=1 Tax=Karstenula rhodostoma CBS 690.94 TaxID=1392251 RepID=A0A9P4PPK8_9PLEO|nr:hypothetical protein P171DRAFT_518842 [Karstenula rhodostoma CBS 690.94]